MNALRPTPDARPARWLLRPGVDWWDLVRFGPPGFEAYVRIAFPGDSDVEGDPEDHVQMAIATLAPFTTTPENGFAAIWEGWAGGGAPEAPRVPIPNREMLLFTGPIACLSDAPALAWYGEAADFQDPHLVWPADEAWCLACEVDEEIEFSVGCSVEAAHALARALPGAVRQVAYGEAAPLYREDG